MGFSIFGAGGGASNDPTVEGTATVIGSTVNQTNVNIHNDGETPVAVELSFEHSRLKGVDPDDGTEESPTYVVDPGTAGVRASRTITLERGAVGVPSGSTLPENVVFTSSAGVQTSIPYSIEGPPPSIGSYIRTRVGTPTIEYVFDSTGANSGTLLTPYNLDQRSGYPSSISTDYQWAEYHVESTADWNYILSSGGTSSPTSDWNSSADRTYITALKVVGNVSNSDYFVKLGIDTGNNGTNTGFGILWKSPFTTNFGVIAHGVAYIDLSGGTGYAGTATTATTANGDLLIFLASVDVSAGTTTYMWRHSNQTAGHTYKVESYVAPASTNTSEFLRPVGESYSGAPSARRNSAFPVRYYYSAILNGTTTNAQFQDVLNDIGLN